VKELPAKAVMELAASVGLSYSQSATNDVTSRHARNKIAVGKISGKQSPRNASRQPDKTESKKPAGKRLPQGKVVSPRTKRRS
jgi:hypothetical protein